MAISNESVTKIIHCIYLAAIAFECAALGLFYNYYYTDNVSANNATQTKSNDSDFNMVVRFFIIALLTLSGINCISFKIMTSAKDASTNEGVYRAAIILAGVVAMVQDSMFNTVMSGGNSNSYISSKILFGASSIIAVLYLPLEFYLQHIRVKEEAEEKEKKEAEEKEEKKKDDDQNTTPDDD